MAESVSPGRSPKAHGLDWRPVVDNYRNQTEGLRDPEDTDRAPGENRDESSPQTPAQVNLRKLQEQLDRNRLDEIAALVLALTYGEMIELANAVWQAQPEGSNITQENLPSLLYRWSKTQSAAPRTGKAETTA